MCELLDSDAGTPAEVAGSLADLRWFNRWFGGLTTVRGMIRAVAGQTRNTSLSILEVAAGEGYLLDTLRKEFETDGIRLEITLLDRNRTHLPVNGSLSKVAADALKLPFSDSSFDVVSCSLFVHHLEPERAVDFAREALRVCRKAVMVHDLIRHPVHLTMAYAGAPLYRSRLTRHDAPASVWQAYNVKEMEGLFRQAGTAKVETQEHFFFRMGLIAWKDRR